MSPSEKKTILLTFDIEDWFQVENFKKIITFDSWEKRELRIEKNTHKILNLLDSFNFTISATFFTLGWVANKLPNLVREIRKRGHEIASHGFNHHLCTDLSENELIKDLTDSKKLLEDLTGVEITGYRAPSFAINNDILKIVETAGYKYDSSYNSFSGHGRYGTIDLNGVSRKGVLYKIGDHFHELPISNTLYFNKIVPFGGGGYFRLYPSFFFHMGIKKQLKENNVFNLYLHPWEFDPDQPRVKEASKSFKFRHYINLNKTYNKLKSLINTFNESEFITCSEYIINTGMQES